MNEYEKVVRDLERSKEELQEKNEDLEKFHDVVVGRELKMMQLEKDAQELQKELAKVKGERKDRDSRGKR